jgi:hypothetical protein
VSIAQEKPPNRPFKHERLNRILFLFAKENYDPRMSFMITTFLAIAIGFPAFCLQIHQHGPGAVFLRVVLGICAVIFACMFAIMVVIAP